MFPLFRVAQNGDNLTEIPPPKKTLQQRFLTLSEYEPFGPLDAAKVLNLEPAQDVLKKLSEPNHGDEKVGKTQKVMYGVEKEGDTTVFRFIPKTAGEVGFRYGAARRDRKKNRKIGFDRAGQMVYLV